MTESFFEFEFVLHNLDYDYNEQPCPAPSSCFGTINRSYLESDQSYFDVYSFRDTIPKSSKVLILSITKR